MLRVPPPHFEVPRFIFEGFSSWFDDVFEKNWKFRPFSAAGARLVVGDKNAIRTSPAPIFLVLSWQLPPPPPLFWGWRIHF